jgi:hypothetical protein
MCVSSGPVNRFQMCLVVPSMRERTGIEIQSYLATLKFKSTGSNTEQSAW